MNMYAYTGAGQSAKTGVSPRGGTWQIDSSSILLELV